MLKEVKDIKKRKDHLKFTDRKTTLSQYQYYTSIHRLNAITIKISTAFFGGGGGAEIFFKSANPQIHVEFQGALSSQNSLEKEQNGNTCTPEYQSLLESYKD